MGCENKGEMNLRPKPLSRRMTWVVISYLLIIFTEIFYRPSGRSPDWILVGLCSLVMFFIFFESNLPAKK